MPIYDFSCRSCGHVFETLVRSSATPSCPECKSEDLDRMLSLPVVKSDTTRAIIKRETKRRDHSQAAEREHAQRQYEASHDD
jgi:putative FmdB family regulatory protein